MRQAGKEEPDILAALDTLNFKQLVPAPMEEVKQIASKAVTQEKGESPLPRKSELTIARHILETMGPDIVFDEAMFWKYSHENEGIWSELDTSEIAKAINDLEGRLYVSGSTDGVEEYKTLTINASTTRGAVHLAQYEASNPNFFNEAPPVVVLTNGALIVERDSVDVSFIDHDKEHRQRASLPFEYDELAICPRWDAFLSEVLPDNEEHGDKQCKLALQQFCGVSLFGLATHYQSCLMLFGSGSNGKSVAMDVISSLFPEGSVASVSPQSFDDDYHAAHLSGKLVNICAETPSVEISRTDRFKAVVSGDPIVARLPYRQPFTMRPRCGHIFAANELFSTRDSTPGFWRRFLPIPWTVTIAQSKRDPNLARKIIETEMPGVFKWALDGLRHVLKNKGYTIPTASEQLKSEWLGESDSVSAFSTDIIIQDDKGKWKFDPIGIKASLLYERYLAWCQSYHHRPVSVTKFGRRMTSLGIEKQREGSGKFYRVDADTKWSSTYEVSPSGADDKTWHN
jgi:P4 family phage/plasmid primase-like protien